MIFVDLFGFWGGGCDVAVISCMCAQRFVKRFEQVPPVGRGAVLCACGVVESAVSEIHGNTRCVCLRATPGGAVRMNSYHRSSTRTPLLRVVPEVVRLLVPCACRYRFLVHPTYRNPVETASSPASLVHHSFRFRNLGTRNLYMFCICI